MYFYDDTVIVYNEIDAYACQWLRNLIDQWVLAGTLIERDIRELDPETVSGVLRFHAFAGIGAWEYALQLAGWPLSIPVWTGSCPCQPFSVAGRRKGRADERHLWPVWYRLIDECRPPVVFGEQVASPDGREWLATVRTEMEALGYAVGAADLCAAGVGAPHMRQRLWFVAVAGRERREGLGLHIRQWTQRQAVHETPRRSTPGLLGDACSPGSRRDARAVPGAQAPRADPWTPSGGVTDQPVSASPVDPWANCQWLPCSDGKSRPTSESGLQPLAHGAAGHVGRLRAYGNAIVPQVAAVFIRAVMESV